MPRAYADVLLRAQFAGHHVEHLALVRCIDVVPRSNQWWQLGAFEAELEALGFREGWSLKHGAVMRWRIR